MVRQSLDLTVLQDFVQQAPFFPDLLVAGARVCGCDIPGMLGHTAGVLLAHTNVFQSR